MSNKEKIKQHLLNRYSITTMKAFRLYSICHLAKYIQLLKSQLIISDVWCTSRNGKRYKNYFCGGLK